LEAVRALFGIADGEEVDPEKLEREQPDWVTSLREAHGHVYGPEYWKTYVKQIASLWLTPLRYTSEEFAAVTDPLLILPGDRAEGVSPEEAVGCFAFSPTRSWPLPRPRITVSSKRKLACLTHSPWISSSGTGRIQLVFPNSAQGGTRASPRLSPRRPAAQTPSIHQP
jgi:hypothetical protein